MHQCHIPWMPKADLEHYICTVHQSVCSKTSKLLLSYTFTGFYCARLNMHDNNTEVSNESFYLSGQVSGGSWEQKFTFISTHFDLVFLVAKPTLLSLSLETKKCLNPSDLMCLVMSEAFSVVYFYLNKCSITDLKFSLLSRQRTWSVWKPFKSPC